MAAQPVVDADMPRHVHHLQGVAESQPWLPKLLQSPWDRWKKEMMKVTTMRRTTSKQHPHHSQEEEAETTVNKHNLRHRSLTLPRLWLPRPSGSNA
jgi:hypothetical protein